MGFIRSLSAEKRSYAGDVPYSSAKPFDETMWADASRALPYAKSKLLSEQAAWEFVK